MTRQYIGARYVTKIYENSLDPSSAEWESGVTYEPLTMVTYLNSSYLSKKNVPGSVGNPPDNPEYWVVTGAYNGQILQLQNDVSDLQNDVGTLGNDVGDLQNDIIRIDQEIADIGDVGDQKIMMIMDSYGTRTDSNGKHVWEIVADSTGATVDGLYFSGASLALGQFTNLVNSYSGSVDGYRTIILVGGANDQLQPSADVKSGMANFCAAVRAKFTDCKKIIVMCSGFTFKSDSNFNIENRIRVKEDYRQSAKANNAIYVANSEYILCNTTLLDNDLCHPAPAGVSAIADKVIEFLLNGYINVDYELDVTATMPDSSTVTGFFMTRHNNISLLGFRGGSGIKNLDYSGGLNIGSKINLLTFDETLIDVNPSTDSGRYVSPDSSNNVYGYSGNTWHLVYFGAGITTGTFSVFVGDPLGAGITSITKLLLMGFLRFYD